MGSLTGGAGLGTNSGMDTIEELLRFFQTGQGAMGTYNRDMGIFGGNVPNTGEFSQFGTNLYNLSESLNAPGQASAQATTTQAGQPGVTPVPQPIGGGVPALPNTLPNTGGAYGSLVNNMPNVAPLAGIIPDQSSNGYVNMTNAKINPAFNPDALNDGGGLGEFFSKKATALNDHIGKYGDMYKGLGGVLDLGLGIFDRIGANKDASFARQQVLRNQDRSDFVLNTNIDNMNQKSRDVTSSRNAASGFNTRRPHELKKFDPNA